MRKYASAEFVKDGVLSAVKKGLNGFTALHWHEFYELEYVIEGAGDYEIDGVSYPISAGMFFLMTPANHHTVRAENCRIFNMMFSERACRTDLLARCVEDGGALAFRAQEPDRRFFETVLDELCLRQSSVEFAACLLDSTLHKCLSYRGEKPACPSYLALATVYLLGHFRESPTLPEVARFTGYTPTYFSAMFRRDTGVTFQQYLDRLRFDYARKLLLSSALTASQVCESSGFRDYPNFLRRFKAAFGVSPTELREKKRK